MFSTISNTKFINLVTLNLSFANSSNLVKAKVLWFGKELITTYYRLLSNSLEICDKIIKSFQSCYPIVEKVTSYYTKSDQAGPLAKKQFGIFIYHMNITILKYLNTPEGLVIKNIN